MKKYIRIFAVIVILISLHACTDSSHDRQADTASLYYIDSLRYSDHYIYVEQTDSQDFLKLRVSCFAWFDPWELPDYGKGKPEDPALVYYRDTIYYDTQTGIDSSAQLLTLKTQNGRSIELLSYFTDHYYYIKEIRELNSYLVVFADPDDMKFYLFDRVSGHRSVLNGYPVVSPDGKIICCTPRECNGVEYCTSFYIYSFSDGTATLQCEKKETFIGRPDLKWKDSQTLYMKLTQHIPMANGTDSAQKIWYAELAIPQFSK